MTVGTSAQGALSTLYMEPGASPHTFDSSSERYEFLHENLRLVEKINYSNGITGTRSERVEQTRKGTRMVRGVIVMNVSPTYLVTLLPRILGAAASGGLGAQTFAVAETLPTFGVLIDRVADTFQAADCYVNRAFISGEQQDPEDERPNFITLALEIFGKEETQAVAIPVIARPTTADYSYFIYDDLVATLVAATRELKKFQLLIHNHLHTRWVNSATPTSICPKHRSIVFNCDNPFTTTDSALYNQLYTGSAGSLAFTNGNCSATFSFGALQVPRKSPVVPGKTELDLELTAFARMVNTTRELSVLLDSVP